MTDKEQRQLCKECKKLAWEVECYPHFRMSGRSSLPLRTTFKIPSYCKYS